MKAVIHQAFCDIFYFHTRAFPLAKIDDAFVRDQSAFAFEEHREKRIEPLRDVVCIQDRDLGRVRLRRCYIELESARERFFHFAYFPLDGALQRLDRARVIEVQNRVELV